MFPHGQMYSNKMKGNFQDFRKETKVSYKYLVPLINVSYNIFIFTFGTS